MQATTTAVRESLQCLLLRAAAATADRVRADLEERVASASAAGLPRHANPLSAGPSSRDQRSPPRAPAHHHHPLFRSCSVGYFPALARTPLTDRLPSAVPARSHRSRYRSARCSYRAAPGTDRANTPAHRASRSLLPSSAPHLHPRARWQPRLLLPLPECRHDGLPVVVAWPGSRSTASRDASRASSRQTGPGPPLPR